MATIEQKYQKLLKLTLASQYYLEGTDNEDPVALVAYLESIKPVPTRPLLQTYQVWNKEGTGCETYAELLILERDNYAHSSEVSTTDIDGLVLMTINEFNGELGYQLLPIYITEHIT